MGEAINAFGGEDGAAAFQMLPTGGRVEKHGGHAQAEDGHEYYIQLRRHGLEYQQRVTADQPGFPQQCGAPGSSGLQPSKGGHPLPAQMGIDDGRGIRALPRLSLQNLGDVHGNLRE